jgi:hypothetical protein
MQVDTYDRESKAKTLSGQASKTLPRIPTDSYAALTLKACQMLDKI